MKSIKELSDYIGFRCFRELDIPEIMASGRLTPYMLDVCDLCPGGTLILDQYGDSAFDVISRANKFAEEDDRFGGTIELLAERVRTIIGNRKSNYFISGGQRGDWIFSGPVARRLGMPAVALYKKNKRVSDRVDIIFPDKSCYGGYFDDHVKHFGGFTAIHVVDLLQEGSSAYRNENGEELGWVPMLRRKGAKVEDLVAVVTRNQGGEEALGNRMIFTHSLIRIDPNFLREHSVQRPMENVAYFSDSDKWSEEYLARQGALELIDYFDPKGTKFEKAKRFLARYGLVLGEANRVEELDGAVLDKFGKTLLDLISS